MFLLIDEKISLEVARLYLRYNFRLFTFCIRKIAKVRLL